MYCINEFTCMGTHTHTHSHIALSHDHKHNSVCVLSNINKSTFSDVFVFIVIEQYHFYPIKYYLLLFLLFSNDNK